MTGPLIPLRQLVLKVQSRCDLACDHCYVFEHADQSWASRPRAISDEVVSWTALRLAEHAKEHALASVQVILHGGEPLLLTPERLRHICEQLRTGLDGVADLDLRVHTNAVRLNERYLDLFAEFEVRVGVSLDGDRAGNDLHRRFADGRSSYEKVLAGLALLRQERYRHLYAGILCTVDVRSDPVAAYEALAAQAPPRIDFLLPHSTWDAPPYRPAGARTPYADWLMTVYRHWDAQGRPMRVRLFDSVISTLSGGPSLTEAMGLAAVDVAVVETDGTFEQVDSLKTAYDGAPATGFTVFDSTLDEVAAHPGVVARQRGLAGLNEKCRSCPVVRSCGGGLYAHRYRGDGSGFDNPSVFCADLKELVYSIDALTGAGADRPIDGFDELADSTDSGRIVRELARSRQQVTRDLLSLVREETDERNDLVWASAWRSAVALSRRDDALLDPLLSHPFTRAWAVRCLQGSAPAGHFAARVAATALTVGGTERLAVPVTDGFVHLAGFGRLSVGSDTSTVELTDSHIRSSGWELERTLAAGGVEFVLDDMDPYRDCFGVPVQGRLSEAEFERWRHALPDAWELIEAQLPTVAAEMAAGVRLLTPLVVRDGQRGASSEGGFAALGVCLTGDPEQLAADLVRGFRLGMLDTLLDVCDLYDEADTRTGMLFGDTYARIATDALRPGPGTGRRTQAQLAELSAAESLTELGRRFVDGMRRSV